MDKGVKVLDVQTRNLLFFDLVRARYDSASETSTVNWLRFQHSGFASIDPASSKNKISLGAPAPRPIIKPLELRYANGNPASYLCVYYTD